MVNSTISEVFWRDWVFFKVSRVSRDMNGSIRYYVLEDLSLVNLPWRLGINRFLGIDSLPFAEEELIRNRLCLFR